jgi:hypothetical protein
MASRVNERQLRVSLTFRVSGYPAHAHLEKSGDRSPVRKNPRFEHSLGDAQGK